jgi:hypothetical protein
MQIILYETSGHWATLIRGRLLEEFALIETRSIDETTDTLQKFRKSLVLLQLHPRQSKRIVTLLRRLDFEFRQSSAVVLGDRRLRPAWEDLVREAGAIDYIKSPRQIGRLINLIEHHSQLVRRNASEIDSDLFLEERILANLPWGD